MFRAGAVNGRCEHLAIVLDHRAADENGQAASEGVWF
jgi:hypothetical protein